MAENTPTPGTSPITPTPAPGQTPVVSVFPGGYNGKILRVNLTIGSTSTEAITEQFCRKYLGGAGFVAYFL